MKVPLRLVGFLGGLLVTVGLGAAVGAAVGPDGGHTSVQSAPPQGEGVLSAVAGYRFVPRTSALAGAGGPFRFTIEGPDGRPVLRFITNHERDLHLIVVSRELTSYAHVHPSLEADGTWSVELPALMPGSYRAVADFRVSGGPALALGVDLSVPGLYQPTVIDEPINEVTVDGLDVRLATRAGPGGVITVSVSVYRDGHLVTDLQPYLGSFGHLVAMRSGDLAYAHVHPLDYRDGEVRFEATLPAAGRYRLYFDFRSGDVVRTAAFSFDQSVVTGETPGGHGGDAHG